jgi:hypothetical protein
LESFFGWRQRTQLCAEPEGDSVRNAIIEVESGGFATTKLAHPMPIHPSLDQNVRGTIKQDT